MPPIHEAKFCAMAEGILITKSASAVVRCVRSLQGYQDELCLFLHRLPCHAMHRGFPLLVVNCILQLVEC